MKRKVPDELGDVNTTPLIDMMFTLIIFLMATTTFQEIERDIKVNLPVESHIEALSSSDKVIVVNVRKSGAYIVQDRQVTPEEMMQMVADAMKNNPDQKVLVRADQEALHGYVARAISACRRAGAKEANIGYQVQE